MASFPPSTQPGPAPSRLQIAFALAIVKLKPDGITVRDFILKLREHIKKGKQVFASEEEHHSYIDYVAYWKARHDEVQQRCRELEERNVQLERWRLTDDAIVIDDDDPVPPKRKRAPSRTPQPAKRARPSTPRFSGKSAAGAHLRGSDGDTVHPASPEVRKPDIMSLSNPDEVAKAKETLAQKVYLTHKLYKQQTSKPEAICFTLVELARAIGSVVATVPTNYETLAIGNLKGSTPMGQDRSELAKMIQASSRAWTSLVFGVQKLMNGVGIQDFHLPGVVIFECVKMFKTIFNSISAAAHQIAHARPVTQPKSSRSRNEGALTPRETGPFRAIAQFLNTIISSLSKDDRHHREIFEGVLFILMERISKLLFFFTFDRHRSATIEGDIARPPAKDDKREIERQIIEGRATRLEAQCLIMILERALGLAPYFMNSPLASRPSSATSRRPSSQGQSPAMKALPRASNAPLVAQAREKLQRTLVQCMFGEEEHDEFADVLRMPGRLGAMPKVAKVEDKDVGEWFSGEVWRLVGWDLLGREGEW